MPYYCIIYCFTVYINKARNYVIKCVMFFTEVLQPSGGALLQWPCLTSRFCSLLVPVPTAALRIWLGEDKRLLLVLFSPHQYFGQSRSHSKHTRWSVGMVCAASEAHEIQRNPQALLLGEAEARLKFGHLISLMPKWLCCHQAQY